MLIKLIVLLTVVPFVELYLLIELTDYWGSFLYTVGLIVGTGILGAWLARREGLRTLGRIRKELTGGRLPGDAMLDGLLILIAGAMLLTPGILTDGLGFLLLIPPTRALARRLLKRWARRHVGTRTAIFHEDAGFHPVSDEPPPGFPPIEDDCEPKG